MRISFDLDGTLIASIGHIHEALSRALEDCNLPPMDVATTRSFVGRGLANLVTQSLAHLNAAPERHVDLSDRVLFHYLTVPCDPDSVFPGVTEALDALKSDGHALSICTNKPFAATLKTLNETKLLPYFDLIVSGDSLPTCKPAPEMLLACAPDLLVGDSEVDAETARRAEIRFLLFSEGYRKSPIDSIPHDAAFDSFAKLPSLV